MTTIKYQLARVQAVGFIVSHVHYHISSKSINLFNFGLYFLFRVCMTNVWRWWCVCALNIIYTPNKIVTEWEGEILEIARISRLDMSAYLCIASNGVPPSVSKRIKVSVDCEYACWWLIWLHSKLQHLTNSIFYILYSFFCE